jgi:tetratricopeptide (TPR) repeat protein
MVAGSRVADEVRAALDMVAQSDAPAAEKAEMLMEIAMGVQQKPKAAEDLRAAADLYARALAICPETEALLSARIRARRATALMATPAGDTQLLEEARAELETALATLTTEGTDEEVAEAEMNLGLVLQNLAGAGRARIQDAISAYQRALRVFDKARHPAEFAILQNNLATAFLSMPFTSDSGKVREALAVQSFEEGLKVVNLVDHPVEYAMLQNNLGNALQYASSSHRMENGFRALEAYDEALKVRTPADSPAEYANTISNKANCLANLPDDPAAPEKGNAGNISRALGLYQEARKIFMSLGEAEKARLVAEAIEELKSLSRGGEAAAPVN